MCGAEVHFQVHQGLFGGFGRLSLLMVLLLFHMEVEAHRALHASRKYLADDGGLLYNFYFIYTPWVQHCVVVFIIRHHAHEFVVKRFDLSIRLKKQLRAVLLLIYTTRAT
jgi:hypothetical protein